MSQWYAFVILMSVIAFSSGVPACTGLGQYTMQRDVKDDVVQKVILYSPGKDVVSMSSVYDCYLEEMAGRILEDPYKSLDEPKSLGMYPLVYDMESENRLAVKIRLRKKFTNEVIHSNWMGALALYRADVIAGQLPKGKVVGKRWKILKKLGTGSFGAVYKVEDINTCEFAALKAEAIQSKGNVLKLEAHMGFIHRDLKPANMAMGSTDSDRSRLIHIFDFGLAREYVFFSQNERPKLRRPRAFARFRGTLRYCSVNTQERGEQGRMDDLWSLLHILVELRGALPWSRAQYSDPYDWEFDQALQTQQSGSTDQLNRQSPAASMQPPFKSPGRPGVDVVPDINPFPAEYFASNPLGF
ncbi:hypothetical protein ANCCEY_01501 [Ancylostoma ceylanicum]|uniref:Protein kinase domain-containing protein n=1 Tax=Ancylostoma ceylanicum TaxID=53326 RepID=A0A0D6MA83_9BILA|nr:hypothetical protein ANCCEY_01501 [Ancylostoma ceylanicum]